jgi:glycosyltransferase involved in cell wall biosynthesis
MRSPNGLSLLQVATRFSAHPSAGTEFRNFHLAKALARHMAVTHVAFMAADAPASAPREMVEAGIRMIGVPRAGSYRVADLVRGMAGPRPFSILNYTRAGMKQTIRKLLDERRYDIVLLEGVHMAEYLALLRVVPSRPAVVCDWHNIESEILFRYSRNAPGRARQWYARTAADKLQQYERRFVNRCDLHVTVSERDRATVAGAYGAAAPVVVIENGVPLEDYADARPGRGAKRFRLLFVGAMDYHANIEAACRFAAEVWPQVRAAVPHLVFTIVGRKPAAAVLGLAGNGIEVTGTVADVRPYYAEAAAAVIPLQVGGGTRIKMLEAMAATVPVVSTRLGAEGLDAIPGKHYLQADSPAAMLAALTGICRDPERAAQLAESGREFVRRHHGWDALGDRLANHLLTLRGNVSARAAGAGI